LLKLYIKTVGELVLYINLVMWQRAATSPDWFNEVIQQHAATSPGWYNEVIH
jgi:hypothetical protein